MRQPFASLLVLPLLAAAAPAFDDPPAQNQNPNQNENPGDGIVRLPAADDWDANLVLDRGDVGIWTVKAFQVFEQYAGPQLVGLDDQGRCWVLVCYSGKWTPFPILQEGEWLGALGHGDLDPRASGEELYVAGKKGTVYQVRSYRSGVVDARLIATVPGEEVHALAVTADALVLFTAPGRVHRLTPTGEHGSFDHHAPMEFDALKGRVRDALVLDDGTVAAASRSGELALLRVGAEGADLRVVHRSPVGKGRVARGADQAGRIVLYTTQDDGVILMHRSLNGTDGGWTTDVIHRGHQGPRGIAAGRFHEDVAGEQVAIFGYSGVVELLAPSEERGAPWTARTVFRDRDKGHWLCSIEIDSRNDTRELAASGFGGRIVLLARPPLAPK